MTIVFTAILGGCDSLKPAPRLTPAPGSADRCVCFTDDPKLFAHPNGWKVLRWPTESWVLADPRREAWRLRCIAHELFPTAVSTVWIDASFTLTDLPRLMRDAKGHDLAGLAHQKRMSCYEEGLAVVKNGQSDAGDVSAQLGAYGLAGFNPSSLTISCVLVRQNNAKVTAFNEMWDSEIRQHPGDNTQLSIDYCAWKNGLSWHHLDGVRKDNPYAVHDHADHKKRRKPYR